jgi:hypothetical protein
MLGLVCGGGRRRCLPGQAGDGLYVGRGWQAVEEFTEVGFHRGAMPFTILQDGVDHGGLVARLSQSAEEPACPP